VAEPDASMLLELGRRAVEFALRRGADEAEAFLSTESGVSVEIERGQIVRSFRRIDEGMGVRAVVGKAVGFSYTNMLTDGSVMEATENALSAARASRPDKSWSGLPQPRVYVEPKGVYDKRVAEVSSAELVEIAALLLEAAASYDRRVLPVAGGVGASVTGTVVVNSNGVEIFEAGTAFGCSMETVARDGTDVTPACFESRAERFMEVDVEAVGAEAAQQAVSSLNPGTLKSGSYPVVFAQAALRSLLYYTLFNAVKADYVQRERSAFRGKLGERVASEAVTVFDDGLLEGGLMTRKFDDEGVPSQKTTLIQDGILRGYLYDSYTAGKDHVESTGNASRPGFASYTSTPTLEPSNFVFKPGDASPEELLEVDEGLIVYGLQGAHSSNPESGEFSVVATPVWKIRNGEVAEALQGVMLTGVVYDLLNNVSALGNNIKKVGQLVAPWIKTENITAIARK